jgi:membrane-associated phospholipid phosphatase
LYRSINCFQESLPLHLALSTSIGQLPMDRSWFSELNSFARATPWLHAAFREYAQYGVVLFAAVLVWSWWKSRSGGDLSSVAAALWAPAGTLLAVGLNQPLGNWVREPRPYTTLQHVEVLVARSSDFSFPSDHAVMAGAVAAGVWLVSRRLGLLTAVAAVLMAFTRVYVGAHYPGDVAVGLLFGAAVTLIGYVALKPVGERIVSLLAETPVQVLLRPRSPSPDSRHYEESAC